jgi:tripartite-type tricarboxylate transporter receptor subunit TctC
MQSRLMIAISLAVLASLGVSTLAQAQAWPQKPVVIIVPFAAGGNTDGIARMTAQRLGEAFGQQFVIENRGGAGGATAAEFAARAEPSGYTLFMAALPVMAIVPAMTKARYNSATDFAPISNIGTNPFVLIVNKEMPVRNLAEFVDYVRARPNALSYASAGAGSLNHLSMALFLNEAHLEMIHVGYKGNGPALSDVIAGHVPAMFSNLSDALPHAASGSVRLIAVSSDKRVPQIPDVPTVAESGFPQFKTMTWNGLMAPAGTPRDIIEKIANEIARAVKDPVFVERLSQYGVDPLGSGPEEFAAMVASDIVVWRKAVDVAGVRNQ